jgi:hypothetical protein
MLLSRDFVAISYNSPKHLTDVFTIDHKPLLRLFASLQKGQLWLNYGRKFALNGRDLNSLSQDSSVRSNKEKILVVLYDMIAFGCYN